MRNRRLSDQVMILEGIANIRTELKAAAEAGENDISMFPILQRLVTMYSLLETEQLVRAVQLADTRNHNERKAA